MRQLLVMVIVPPLVGLMAFTIFRLFWKRQEASMDRMARRHKIDVH